jgi:hypothetical protein
MMMTKNADGLNYYYEVDNFWIDPEASKFRLHLEGVRGNTLNYAYGNGNMWTTTDNDNDTNGGNCSNTYMAPFWYSSCHSMNPLGDWMNTLYAKASCHFLGITSGLCDIMNYFAWGFRAK